MIARCFRWTWTSFYSDFYCALDFVLWISPWITNRAGNQSFCTSPTKDFTDIRLSLKLFYHLIPIFSFILSPRFCSSSFVSFFSSSGLYRWLILRLFSAISNPTSLRMRQKYCSRVCFEFRCIFWYFSCLKSNKYLQRETTVKFSRSIKNLNSINLHPTDFVCLCFSWCCK